MLPKIKHPLNTFIIPSTKQEVTVRPYLAKEEKILLIAKETNNGIEILNAVKQIINNCIVSPDTDVNKLTTFDIEYLFLKLRAISVSNIIHLEYTDTEETPDDKGNKKTYAFDIDLLKVEVSFPTVADNKIRIDDKMGIIMKYLTIDIPATIYDKNNEMDVLFDLIKLCIDKIWDGNELYIFQEQDEKEKIEFIDSLPNHVLEQLSIFFKNTPKLSYTIDYVNALGHNRKIKLETLDDFFAALNYTSLVNLYMTNWTLVQHHPYTMYDVEHMYPYERDLYVNLINNEDTKKQAPAESQLKALGIEPKWDK